jgi:hypothetical protein
MKTLELTQLAPELSGPMQAAAQEDFVILINGKPGGHLLWFADEDDAFDHQLTATPQFKKRVTDARQRFAEGKGTSLEEVRRRLGA